MRKIKGAFLVVLFVNSCHVYSSPIEDYFLNKKYWQSVNWDKFEDEKIWKDNRFESRDVQLDGSLNGGVQKYFKNKTSAGNDVYFSYKKIKINAQEYYAGVTSVDLESGDCNKMLETYKINFGRNPTVYDESYRSMWDVSEKTWQWPIGNTFVTFNCLKISPHSKDMISVKYKKSIAENSYEAPVNLLCNTKFDGKDNPAWPLILLTNKKMVINGNRVLIAKLETNDSEYKISFFPTENKFNMTFSVNRYNGQVTGMGIRDGYEDGIALTGKCEKQENFKKLF